MLFVRRQGTQFGLSEWSIAMAVAAIGLLIQQQPPHLTDPARCPGLLEWTAVTFSRSATHVPLASFVSGMNAVGVVLALVALTRLIQRAAGTFAAAAAAVSVAAAVTLVTTPTLAPSNVIAIGSASAAWLACANSSMSAGTWWKMLACLALAVTAAIAPPLTVPLALGAAWLAWQTSPGHGPSRVVYPAAAAVIVLALPIFQTLTMAALPGPESAGAGGGCLLPVRPSVQTLEAAISQAISGMGPMAFALAMLGVFTLRRQVTAAGAWPFAAIAGLSIAAAASPGSDPVRTLAPVIAAFWWVITIGIREAAAALTGRPTLQVGMWLLLAIFPLLQWTHRSSLPIAPADDLRGQERLTLRDMSHLVGALPTDSTVVVDDAITDLLLRAASSTVRQSGKVLRFVSHDSREAKQAAAGRPLFALPRAQFTLQHLGLSRAESIEPGIPGVVALERGGECTTLELRWRVAPGLSRSNHVALASSRPDARGPVVIYLGSSTALNPYPVDWPEWTTRGYHADRFDTAREADRQRLNRLRTEDGAPAEERVFGFAFLTRLELWRVPNAPMILKVGLAQPPDAALAHGSTPGDRADLRVCPSFPMEAGRLEVRR